MTCWTTLRAMVETESFTRDKAGVDRMIDLMQSQFTHMQADAIERFPHSEFGDFLLATWNKQAPGKPFLFLVHVDTVHPARYAGEHAGQNRRRPLLRSWRPGYESWHRHRPGSDRRTCRRADQLPRHPIHFLVTSEEEIGSPHSEPLIKQLAADCALVLVMEPATGEGAIKTWRKGGGQYELTVDGRASHAGIAPEQGINAIIEFARQALEINALNDLKYGTSVSITMVEGGSAGNVIPALGERPKSIRAS